MINGIEKPNFRVVLASKISPQECAQLNLGYQDPTKINPKDFMGQEDSGILYVPKAGETLYRLKESSPGQPCV
jgi:hypothetical protein